MGNYFNIAPQPCRESSVTYDYVSGTSDTTFISPRYCTSETYATVCSDGISDGEADLICQQQGYSGTLGFKCAHGNT